MSWLDALPEVIKAVEGKVGVFVDGGIRHGTGVLKTLALGVRGAVFIGRPVLWDLAYQVEVLFREATKESNKDRNLLAGFCSSDIKSLLSGEDLNDKSPHWLLGHIKGKRTRSCFT
ncbi:Hydroxyacid oxidase 1 [Desmophyllum pertusum]|uniref:Hydroxyacid oxidase 1 n=1 Tax=Desmophyllum pertusum TaxID=174260 RepID=A0A9W9ZMK3_9CNID|nr:Hydroxyacid oxidase 1 [Desmophyllum pertusum]